MSVGQANAPTMQLNLKSHLPNHPDYSLLFVEGHG
jgi:hypothetical protein